MLFSRKKNTKIFSDTDIVAPVDGEIFPIEEVSDSVFAQQMLGQSVSIRPLSGELTLVAPANGVLEVIYPTGHAYAVKMNNGIELLVHIGIDTVELKGKYFKALEKQESTVNAGQPIVKVDFDNIKNEGYDVSVMLIVTKNPTNEEIAFLQNQGVHAADKIIL